MEYLLDFARGPLFRFCFALMVLGLLRLFFLTIYGIIRAWLRAGDKTLRWNYILRYTLYWLFPAQRVFVYRPFYSVLSIVFHIGLIVTPIFLFSHIRLWAASLGFGWPALNKSIADILTISTITAGVFLIIGRISSKASRSISRKQDFLWVPLLLIPFITGMLGVNGDLAPKAYRIVMLVHFLSADLIFALTPFTKVAHCVLMPFSQLVSAQGWRFPANYGDDVETTLGRKELPI